MAIAKIKIKQATLNQLKAFAEAHLGIYFQDGIAVGAARAQVEQAWGHDTISVQVADDTPGQPAAAQPAAVAPPQAAPPAQGKGGRPVAGKDMVTVFIDERDEPGGDRPVEVGVNGKMMVIPRGQDVQIPYPYYLALLDAKVWVYVPKKDANGTINGLESTPREHLQYPVRLVYDPRAAERQAEAARRTEEHEKINAEMEARKQRAA